MKDKITITININYISSSYRGQECDPDTDDEGQIKVRVVVVSLRQRVVHHPVTTSRHTSSVLVQIPRHGAFKYFL